MTPYFEGHIKTGIITCEHVYVLLYPKSLVICYVTRSEFALGKKRIKEEMREKRIGWMQWAQTHQELCFKYGERYAMLDEKSAVEKNSRNKKIRYADIIQAKYCRATEDCDGEMNILCQGRLALLTKAGKTIIRHSLDEDAPQEQELRRLIRQLDITPKH